MWNQAARRQPAAVVGLLERRQLLELRVPHLHALSIALDVGLGSGVVLEAHIGVEREGRHHDERDAGADDEAGRRLAGGSGRGRGRGRNLVARIGHTIGLQASISMTLANTKSSWVTCAEIPRQEDVYSHADAYVLAFFGGGKALWIVKRMHVVAGAGTQ